MSKLCIICDQRAGSGEHVFPAALGGRRVDKGIYCGPHNTGFSPLAAHLTEQLRVLNALLAVRPDHKPRSVPLDVPIAPGRGIRVFDGEVGWLEPVQPGVEDAIPLGFSLGGPVGLQAVAYIALTFFAHHFQNEARSPGLGPAKAFVVSGGENDFVWWERDSVLQDALPPFEFAHSIVVGTSAASGEAYAAVSLFGVFHFGARLGRLDGAQDRKVTTWINPLADRPPHDRIVEKADSPLQMVKPDPITAHLERTIREGVAERQMQTFLNKIQRKTFERDMVPLLAKLNGVAGQPQAVIARVVEDVLSHEGTRLYKLLRAVYDEFAQANEGDDIGRLVISTLRALMEVDPSRPSNLSVAAEGLASQLGGELGRELVERLSAGEIDVNVLHHLFESGPAMHRAGTILFRPVQEGLGIAEPADR